MPSSQRMAAEGPLLGVFHPCSSPGAGGPQLGGGGGAGRVLGAGGSRAGVGSASPSWARKMPEPVRGGSAPFHQNSVTTPTLQY